MIYTDLTKKAMKLCFEAHQHQVDKSGLPYVFHPFHLAEQMEDTTAVALLHGVLDRLFSGDISYVWVCCFQNNFASKRLIEKMGFEFMQEGKFYSDSFGKEIPS